jgi:hypothetical protein
MQKHVDAKVYIYYFYAATVWSTWSLEECKKQKIFFMILFNPGIGK